MSPLPQKPGQPDTTPPTGPGERFVLYSEVKGIFLGEKKWSNVNPGYDNGAITFNEVWADYFVKWFLENDNLVVTKIKVETDMDFNLISPAALENQGLPSWVPESPPQKTGKRRRLT